ncbi:di-heme oxidoredictase family protein [Azotobacter vinelandii]|uniref:di-heme oxidoreductase family protein n=1 Tax=Azotobacter vinelandii TaxID=354 RepID=UPI000774BAA4|nr:di-heme oxidoredictase family protein [Azotobacter vinelandii]WKN22021.1 thiol oxidoreductase [Azotobacter vinelandii]
MDKTSKQWSLGWLLAGLLGWSPATMAQDGVTVADVSRQAFSQPLPGLDAADRERFARGRGLFRQVWVVSPSLDGEVDGLGPLYNRPACGSCHPLNGRGQAPDGPRQRLRSMLVRLSLPGENDHGGPLPHPDYGDQLNDAGIPGVPPEGRAAIAWEELPFRFPDGESLMLRRPRLALEELAYGPLDGVLTSLRIGPPVFGLGLLEAVPEETLLEMAARPVVDGIQGRVNRVWSTETGDWRVGRFGLKANVASLREQTASAMAGDLGITSRLYPDKTCTPVQDACRQAAEGGQPELDDTQLDDLVFYQAHLAVPARRQRDDPQVQRGEAQFLALGCAACHRPQLRTGDRATYPLLRNRTIHPYTDLLLHDMGEGLADGRPDHRANGREWRTPPLWGISLVESISPPGHFLHDGRARNFTEAILWHAGEALAARERFVALPAESRQALLAFLKSL